MANDVLAARDRCMDWHGRCVELTSGGVVSSQRVGPKVLGIFPGEGIGPEVVGAALEVLDAVEGIRPVKLVRRVGGDIGTAVNADGELHEEAAEFCTRLFAEGAAILCGPGGGRFVYDLRRRFDLYCKLAP